VAFGWKNPIPLEIGGGPTTVELTYEALRRAHGRGPGQADAIGPRDGLRDLWTKCEAIAVATSLAHWEHAFWQAFPNTSTDFVTVWENILGIPSADTLVERQRLITAAYIREIDATIPGIREALKDIDTRFDVDSIPDDLKIITIAGKEFGPLPGAAGAAFGSGFAASRQSTAFPNFADDFIVRVRFLGLPTDILLAQAADLLNEVLPSWVSFEIYNLSDGPEGEGFYLDGGPDSDSFLDLTAITP
jgi:hypothetical protein